MTRQSSQSVGVKNANSTARSQFGDVIVSDPPSSFASPSFTYVLRRDSKRGFTRIRDDKMPNRSIYAVSKGRGL